MDIVRRKFILVTTGTQRVKNAVGPSEVNDTTKPGKLNVIKRSKIPLLGPSVLPTALWDIKDTT